MALIVITEELLKQPDVVGCLTLHYGGMKEIRILRNPIGPEGGTRTYYVEHSRFSASYQICPTISRTGNKLKVIKDE